MVAFTIFWFSVYRYGIFYMIAFILWYLFLARIWKQEYFKKYPKLQKILTTELEDMLCVLVIWVLLWWRLWHVLIYWNWYYFHHLWEIFKVWEWGMSFIWWIIWVWTISALYLYLKKLTWKEILIFYDIILIITPLGILIWRLWNYLNQELYWIPISEIPNWLASIFESLWLTHNYSNIDKEIRVNTNFLSMILEGALIFILQIISFYKMIKNHKYKIWRLSTNFMLYYPIIRFFLEYLRADSQEEFVWIFTKSQRFFLLFILIAISVKYQVRKREPLTIDKK
jgi:phosphatidylglycerol:prolipoprotein diacylglycerol transferase